MFSKFLDENVIRELIQKKNHCDDESVIVEYFLHFIFDVFMLILPSLAFLGIMCLMKNLHIFEFERTLKSNITVFIMILFIRITNLYQNIISIPRSFGHTTICLT